MWLLFLECEKQKIFFIWMREIGAKFDNFDYQSYLSRESIDGYQAGYVIDWITPENISKYQEFYICGSPAMVKSAREKLEALGVV